MKKTVITVGVFFIALLMLPSASAFFAPSYSLRGTLTKDSNAFFIGKTVVTGAFTGYPVDQLIDSPLVKDLGGFPLIAATSISNLNTVTVVENIDISSVTSLEDLLTNYSGYITSYSDVEIDTEEGLFLLGISQGTLNISAGFTYAVTSFLPLEILPDTITRFFVTVTNTPLIMHCSGDYSVLSTLSESSTIRIADRQGTLLWSGGSPNDYIIIQDTAFAVTQSPPLSLLPLNAAASTVPLILTVTPADSNDIAIKQLLENISTTVTTLGMNTTSEFIKNIKTLGTLAQTTSGITNGALVFFQTNETMTIDRSTQKFSSLGFVRFRTLTITNVGLTVGPALQADCKLSLLGSHFFNPQAKQSSDGIAFPYELVIIWILALCIFVYIYFFVRPPINLENDGRIKRFAFVFHIIVLLIAFVLLDFEVNDLLGISGLTALSSQGFSLVTGVLLLLEVIIWTVGYLILAIPIQLLTYAVLRLLGIGKGGNGIRKAIGDLSIWIFCGLYLLLFLNIIVSLIPFTSLFSMG